MVEAAGLDELAKEVQARVAKRVQQLPLLGLCSIDASSDDKKELLKSGRLLTAGIQMLHKVDLPHKFVY